MLLVFARIFVHRRLSEYVTFFLKLICAVISHIRRNNRFVDETISIIRPVSVPYYSSIKYVLIILHINLKNYFCHLLKCEKQKLLFNKE
jgi:hypothetical protein